MAVVLPKPEDDSQFRIEATGSFREPRTRILKHGNTFAVLDSFGDMAGINGNPDGLYHEDTRFLSRLELVSVHARGGISAVSARRAECPSTWSPARA